MNSPRLSMRSTLPDYIHVLYTTKAVAQPPRSAEGTISFPAGQLEKLWSIQNEASGDDDGERSSLSDSDSDDVGDGVSESKRDCEEHMQPVEEPSATVDITPGKAGISHSGAPVIPTPPPATAATRLISQIAAEEAIAAEMRRRSPALTRQGMARSHSIPEVRAASPDLSLLPQLQVAELCPPSGAPRVGSGGPSSASPGHGFHSFSRHNPVAVSLPTRGVQLPPPFSDSHVGTPGALEITGAPDACDASPSSPTAASRNLLWRREQPIAHLPPHLATAYYTRDAALSAAAELLALGINAKSTHHASPPRIGSPASAVALTSAALSPYISAAPLRKSAQVAGLEGGGQRLAGGPWSPTGTSPRAAVHPPSRPVVAANRSASAGLAAASTDGSLASRMVDAAAAVFLSSRTTF